jgi:NADH dehydrogenase (ubiquinone) 1 alpha subcomplex subunit 13
MIKKLLNKIYFFIPGFSMILGYAAVTTGSLYLYYLNCKDVKRHEIEMRSSRLAMYPMLLAERDRA